jgi:RNA polymerase sigma factor (sigma-70 family)
MVDDASGTTFRIQRSLDRLAQGDASARDELFSYAQNRLVALTKFIRRDFRRIPAVHDTDDVLQQAQIRLLRALEAVQPTSAADFFRLAALQIRRVLLDLIRQIDGPGKVPRPPTIPIDRAADSNGFPSLLADDSGVSPPELAGWSEFHVAVDRLPELEQQAFELVWYHDLSKIEAAEIMGISERHFRRVFTAARLHLREILPGFFDQTENDVRFAAP